MKNRNRFKFIIVLFFLIVGLLGLGLSIYFFGQAYQNSNNPINSEYFIGTGLGINLAGCSGFISLFFLYLLGIKKINKYYYYIFFSISLFCISPMILYSLTTMFLILFEQK